MNERPPFVIQIFVAEGRPDGVRLVEKSNWIGLGIVFPRGRYGTAKKREEFLRSGVYVLVGHGTGDVPDIYIGEGEIVRDRLKEHYENRDFWQQAIVFTTTGTQLNKAEIKHLEARLLELAKTHRRCHLENKQTPRRPTLSEPAQAVMEGYLTEMLSLLPVLGVEAFEAADSGASSGGHVYHLKTKDCDASGIETNTGFRVKEGSRARGKATASLEQHLPTYHNKRQQLIEGGILAIADTSKGTGGYRFTKDYTFSSASLAAAVCSGQAISGLTAWKDSAGSSIKDNRKREAEA